MAAGLSLEELRALARGDLSTEKPNSRFLAHTFSMLLHMRPRTYLRGSTWFTHTFRLGYFTTFFFVVEIVTGLILMVYYRPTPDGAYASILKIMSQAPFGSLIRDIHRLAAEGMVVCAVLHLLRTFLTASYKGRRAFTWLTGVVLLVFTLGMSFSGYLLPWDQMSYWAVTIGTSMAESIPVWGREINLLLRGAAEIGAEGLLRFYLLHVLLLPLLTIVFLAVHYYRVARIHGISLPAYVEEGDVPVSLKEEANEKVPFLPELFTHEVLLAFLGILVLVAMAVFFYDAPLEHQADPRLTPLDTQAPWFFLWVQGLQKLGDKMWMGVMVPSGVLALLLAVPYIDRNPRRMLKKRPMALGLATAAILSLSVLTYMGNHHYGISLPPATRILQDVAPEEGIGLLRRVPYDQLIPGVYVTGVADDASLPSALAEVLHDFGGRVEAAQADGAMVNARSLVMIEEWQADLKKVTLRILWTDSESGESKSLDREIYMHRHTSNQEKWDPAR